MARYSKERELNIAIKTVRKAMQPTDARIRTPASVRGGALLQKLEGVSPSQKPQGFGLLASRATVARMGVALAAAFVLVIGLVYGIHSNGQFSGPIAFEEVSQHSDSDKTQVAEEAQEALNSSGAVTGGGAQASTDDAGSGTTESPQSTPPMGMGGGGRSTVLGDIGSVTFVYRKNDRTDPDKEDFPITVEIVDNQEGEVISRVDIPDIRSVDAFYADQDSMVLVGPGDKGVVTRCYDIQEVGEPAEELVIEQEGELYACGDTGGATVYTLTQLDESTSVSAESIELPGGGHGSGILVTAVDITDAGPVFDQKLLEGSILSMTIEGETAAVTYEVEDENGEMRPSTARLLLSGEEIVLRQDG